MMFNPYVLIAGGVVVLLLTIGGYFKGRADMDSVWKEKALVAEQQARVKEQELQEKTDAVTKKYQAERTRINARLADALEQLRQRPARPVSEDTQAPSNCGTGASLYAEDAGFLVREAARADELRAALDACQQWAKEVSE